MPRSLICLFLLAISLLFPKLSHAQEFFFQEEFNESRPDNSLDTNKWNTFSNNQGSFATIKEFGGNILLNQQNNTNKYPYAITKNQALPGTDYSAEIKFQYTKITPWGAGIILTDIQPPNGSSQFQNLININVWQDSSFGQALRIGFDGAAVFQAPITTSPHTLKIDRIGKRYFIYFDGVLTFTSNETSEVVKYIFIGNPGLVPFIVPQWTTFNVDYIRVTQTAPQPFLDLPWDYASKGLTFNDAANRINSFFDHEYPLLSSNLFEPTETLKSIIRFNSNERKFELYSTHDGYDYGKVAKVNVNDPQLAAADGEATFLGSCTPCGNAILIDHKNGFQTRYYHLQKDGLITNTPGQKVNVTRGQQIGKVGGTGNVQPKGDAGAHIHFMVVNDKDKDGNFENNLPDGVVDPFGWQSSSPDPWENYTFFYNGKQRTGSKSFYLFTKQLDNLNTTLTSNGGVFNSGRYELKFPQGTTSQNLNLNLKQQPNTSLTDKLKSLGAVLYAEAKDALGNEIQQYQSIYTLTVEALQEDLARFKPETISIYSSQDGQTWSKEQTSQNKNKFSTQINHMTYFALAGERLDEVPPATTPFLGGAKGENNFYRSDVNLSFESSDNENGLGVDYIQYKLEDQDWETYSTPINFAAEGKYKIEFYAVDNDENFEEVKSVEFTIDKTIPEAKIYIDPTKFDLVVLGVDNNTSNVTKQFNKNDAVFIIEDTAGNTLKINTQFLNKDNLDHLKIISLQYNNQDTILTPDNWFKANYQNLNDPNLKTQQFEFTDQYKILINYNKNKNISKIIKEEQGVETLNNNVAGQALLQLKTNQGKLEYSY